MDPTKANQNRRHAKLARAVLVTGKGGVGKTTLSAALAVAALKQGQQAVMIEFGDGESGRRALGFDSHGVQHVVIHPDEAFSRAATPLFGSKMLSKLVLGNFAMRRLLRAAPALRELAMLESVRLTLHEYPEARVVVDMPATGHGLAWLRVPQQVAAITSPGPLRRLVDRLGEELVAPGKASIVVVTLPERMVLQETVELCRGMRAEVGLEPARLIINKMPIAMPERALSATVALATRNDAIGTAAGYLAHSLEVRQVAREQAAEALSVVLRDDDIEPITLPLSPTDPSAPQVADWLIGEEAA